MRRERRIKRKRRQKKRREIKQTKILRRMEKVREIRLGHLLERITVYNHQSYRKRSQNTWLKEQTIRKVMGGGGGEGRGIFEPQEFFFVIKFLV